MSGPTVALISRDNGVGLTVDMELLESILVPAGYSVFRTDWRAPRLPRPVDVAIFLELWNPRLARYAKKTVGIFNLEWFQNAWAKDLRTLDQLWAKSRESFDVYTKRLRLRNAHLTGFSSRDLNDPSVQRQSTALHLRGHSDFKNTHAVIDAWRQDPTLPPLTIISSVPLEVPHYVRVLGRISNEELRREMNAATFHVCPSRAEGWGHYITEALSVGALVISTDASPMNEHVHPDWGALIRPSRSNRHGLVSVHDVTAQAVAEAVRRAAATTEAARAEMSKRARASFEWRNHSFQVTALDLLARI